MSLLTDELVERIIDEIETRSALYDKNNVNYMDSNLKKRLWVEVCKGVFVDWDAMTEEQKSEAGKEVQSKWKSLRSSFSRELRQQKTVQSGAPASKRRKYIYFDRLLFLLPHTQPKPTASNLTEGEVADADENPDDVEDQHDRHDSQEQHSVNITTKRQVVNPRGSAKKSGSNTFESDMLSILSNKQQEGKDEDVTFAMSLVPFLKRITESQKLDVRIDILQVLRRYTNAPATGSLQTMSQQNPAHFMEPPVIDIRPQQSASSVYTGPSPSSNTFSNVQFMMGQQRPHYARPANQTYSRAQLESPHSNSNESQTTYDYNVYSPESEILELGSVK